MPSDAEPPADAELARLLNAYTLDALEIGAVMGTEGLRRRGDNGVRACEQTASYATLLAYIADRYVRRDRLVPDEWDDLDATAPVKDDYTAARGVLPWQEDDELPEDAIRRLRDGE